MEDGAPPHRCLAGAGGSPRHVGGSSRELSRAGLNLLERVVLTGGSSVRLAVSRLSKCSREMWFCPIVHRKILRFRLQFPVRLFALVLRHLRLLGPCRLPVGVLAGR